MSTQVCNMQVMVRVNGVKISHMRLRRDTVTQQTELLIHDDVFGVFPIDTRFNIEMYDLSTPSHNRTWKKVSYHQLILLIEHHHQTNRQHDDTTTTDE